MTIKVSGDDNEVIKVAKHAVPKETRNEGTGYPVNCKRGIKETHVKVEPFVAARRCRGGSNFSIFGNHSNLPEH